MRFVNSIKLSTIAYFSMEVGIDPAVPTYSGGLGILAGDTLRSAADMHVPMVGVTLLHRKGYFSQRIGPDGSQIESPVEWRPEDILEPLDTRARVEVEGRTVHLRVWRYVVEGVSGHDVPVYFLDSDLPENGPFDRTLTDHLYGGDDHYRLCQETLLGIGGVAALRALGLDDNTHYHMNEGHSALLVLALLEERTAGKGLSRATEKDVEAVQWQCVFTTHTPVPAGHDKFPMDMARKVIGPERAAAIEAIGCSDNGVLNMTYLALFFSRFINGVAMRHGGVSRDMFPRYPITAITNGVHAGTWTSEPFRELFDRHIPGWRHDNFYLRYAMDIPIDEIWKTHMQAKRGLIAEVERVSGVKLAEDTMTIGFARRSAAYKRADLLFTDKDRLRKIAANAGPLQIIYAGKAHPRDWPGKELIKNICRAAGELKNEIKIVYLEDYDIDLAKLLCAGVDLWLNTPLRPLEASGTSGMKAALNGVPSLSILDGWWVEGHVEGVTGWAIGGPPDSPPDQAREAADLYGKLENVIVPMFYTGVDEYALVMRSAIAFNGSFFNTHRMVSQYVINAYFPVEEGH